MSWCICVNIVLHCFQLKNWEVLPNDKPLLSAYSRASGQEWFFADMNKDFIQNIIKVREKEKK